MDSISASERRRFLLIVCFGMFNVGMVFGSTAPLLVSISTWFSLRLGQVGLPVAIASLGALISNFFFSFVWSMNRARYLLSIFAIFSVAVLLTIPVFHPTFVIVLTLLFAMEFGRGFLNVAFDAVISEVFWQRRAKYLNLLHVFIGLGALVVPIIVGVIIAYVGKWYLAYLVLGLAGLPLPFLFIRRSLYSHVMQVHKEVAPQRKRRMAPMKNGAFWALMVVMFLGSGAQLAFASWSPVFLVKIHGASPALASYSVSVFWLAVMVMRIALSKLLRDADVRRFLTMVMIAATGVTSLTFLMPGIVTMFALVACSGVLLGVTYPASLALGANIFPRYVGLLTGFLSGSAAIGILFCAWIIGPISELIGLRIGVFVVPVFTLLAMVAVLRSHPTTGNERVSSPEAAS